MHDVHSVCFVITDLRSLSITCLLHMRYKCLEYESKMVSILNLIVGSSVACPLNTQLFPNLKFSGLLFESPTELPTISVYESSG